MLSETQEKLAGWGAWQRSGGGIGYKSSALSLMRSRSGGGLPLPPISDDQALGVDRVVAVLKRYNRGQFDCIEMAYVFQFGSRKISRQLGVTRYEVDKRIGEAEEWIDRQLEARTFG